jgi:hypothetical protein
MQTPAEPQTPEPMCRPSAPSRAGARRRVLAGLALPAATLLALALALAGCGSSSSPGVAHLGTTTSSNAASGDGGSSSADSSASLQQKMVALAKCMRTHGEPEFPEPVEGHLTLSSGHGTGINQQSSQFQAASKACEKLTPAPGGGEASPQVSAKVQEQLLKFSECMRTHGAPSFPDPPVSSGGSHRATKGGRPLGGLDPNSPEFKAANKACQSVGPGSTKAVGGSGGESGAAVAVP